MNTLKKLGFWSAILSALFSILWFVLYISQEAIAPMPEWINLQAYAKAFTPLRLLIVYPSLLLPLTFIALLASIHYSIPVQQRVWSLIALSIGILYATMAIINYNIQAVAVRQSLAAGETLGIAMFLPDNPHSIFTALANSYVYMALSMVAAGFVFEKRGIQRWVRWIFFAQIITAVGQAGWSMFGLSETVFILTSMVWVIGAPLAFILVGVLFIRGGWEGASL